MEELLLQCLWGALAGYITDEYAIKHIFKDLGPIKSVVSKERNSLSESLANMVETKILRGPALAQAVNSEKTANHLRDMIVCAAHGMDVRLDDIHGFSSAANGVAELLARELSAVGGSISELKVGDIIGSEEMDRLWKAFSDWLNVGGALRDIVGDEPELTIGDLVPNAATDVQCAVRTLLAEKGDEIAAVLADDCGLGEGLAAFAHSLKGKKVRDLISGGDDRVKAELSRLLRDFAASPRCERVIEGLIAELAGWLRESDIHPLDLLPDGFEDGLRGVCVRICEAVLPDLLEFVDGCDADITDILSRSVETCLGVGLGGGLTKIKLVRELLLERLSDRWTVTRVIRSYIENNLSPAQLGESLAGEVCGYLRGTTLSGIMADLDGRNLIEPKKIVGFITLLLKDVDMLPDRAWQRIIELDLPDLTPLALRPAELIREKGGAFLREKSAVTADMAFRAVQGLSAKRICEFDLSAVRLPEKPPFNPDAALDGLLPDEDRLKILLEKLLKEFGSVELSRAAVSLAEGKAGKRLALTIRDFALSADLTALLRVRETISDKINDMDMDALCELVESYMGEYLRPLCLFGAGIGAGVGALLWEAERVLTLPFWVGAPVFALIGVITNVLALQGLFRPYERRLCFQGLLPANKAKIAEKTAELAETELLSPELLREGYSRSSAEIKAGVSEKIRLARGGMLDYISSNKSEWAAKAERWLHENTGKILTLRPGAFAGAVEGLPEIVGRSGDKISAVTERYLAANSKKAVDASIRALFSFDREKLWKAAGEKKIGQLLPKGAAGSICDMLAMALAKIALSPETGRRLASRLGDLLASSSGETVGTAFGSAAAKFIENKRDSILAALRVKLIDYTSKNRAAISGAISSALVKKHPFIFMLMGADTLIDGVVNYIFDNEFEDFLDRQSQALGALFDKIMERYVYPVKLEELRLKSLNLGAAAADFLSGENRCAVGASAIGHVLKGIYREVAGVKASSYMELLHMRSFGEADARLGGALSAFLAAAEKKMRENGFPPAEELIKLLSPSAARAADSAAKRLAGSAAFAKVCALRAEELRRSKLSLGDFIDEERLRSLAAALPEGAAASLTENLIGGLGEALPEEFTNGFADLLVSASVDALTEHIGALVKDLDVAAITEESVNSLSGREIRELLSFADPFFRSIKIWGVTGLMYGINNTVSAVVTVAHFGSKIVGKIIKKIKKRS